MQNTQIYQPFACSLPLTKLDLHLAGGQLDANFAEISG
jgi:hypothetical protein